MFARGLSVVWLAAIMLAGTRVSSQAPVDPVTYSEEQASRGEGVFKRVCLECHGRKDMTSADFRVKWNGRSAFDLFERIRSTMPESGPGSLPRADYLDVTAFISKINGLPAGSVELPNEDAAMRKQLLALPPPSAMTMGK